ncbi:MAG: CapA family protein [Blastocatellia bacterium]|nr:CapA family protein [Blastocatellia bacterium]
MRSPHRSRFLTVSVFTILVALGLSCGGQPQPVENSGPTTSGPSTGAPRKDLTVLAVGDINLGRVLGKRILAGQKDLPFRNVRTEISGADIAFANLESQISEQKGQTEGSSNYVFTGPPQGADELANAGFDVVSTANNHAWDFGERALNETIDNLKRVNIAHVGTGETLDAAYAPVIVERNGWRVGFLAVTGVFNSPFEQSPARDHVAWADPVLVALKIKELRHQGVDVVLVSYHGGVEYSPIPTSRPGPSREPASMPAPTPSSATTLTSPRASSGTRANPSSIRSATSSSNSSTRGRTSASASA